MRTLPALTLLLAAALPATALAQAAAPAASPTRGELLYTTHCVGCHNTQMHWRDNRRAADWPSLKAWVRHWQAQEKLQWSEADIVDVARHLNDRIYRFPQTEDRTGRAPVPAAPRAARAPRAPGDA
jgi:hypothetical protein